MKYLILILIIFISCTLFGQVKIYDSLSKEELSLESFTQRLSAYQVIFFGEMHGVKPIHELEHAILPGLYAADANLTLSFEMWERDTQATLDAFLQDAIGEDEFTQKSRVWDNYEDYRPLLIFAKEHNLKAIAANIPRIYAAQTVRESTEFLAEMNAIERGYIAQNPYFEDETYRARFFEVMGMDAEHAPQNEMFDRYYQAQVIKDATMAESIANALKEEPKNRILHYNGDFHSRAHLGSVTALKELMPALKIAVITSEVVEDDETDITSRLDESIGDYILILKRSELRRQK